MMMIKNSAHSTPTFVLTGSQNIEMRSNRLTLVTHLLLDKTRLDSTHSTQSTKTIAMTERAASGENPKSSGAGRAQKCDVAAVGGAMAVLFVVLKLVEAFSCVEFLSCSASSISIIKRLKSNEAITILKD
jgi:hypothetical protein